jgi:hypothetical protein
LLFGINEQMVRAIQKHLTHVSLAKHYTKVKGIKYWAEVLCFQMPASNHQYPNQILLWLMKLFIKDWLFKQQHNSLVLHAQRHLDDHKKSGDEQFFYSNKCAVWTAFSTEKEGKLPDYITTASHNHYGLSRGEAYQFAKELTEKIP